MTNIFTYVPAYHTATTFSASSSGYYVSQIPVYQSLCNEVPIENVIKREMYLDYSAIEDGSFVIRADDKVRLVCKRNFSHLYFDTDDGGAWSSEDFIDAPGEALYSIIEGLFSFRNVRLFRKRENTVAVVNEYKITSNKEKMQTLTFPNKSYMEFSYLARSNGGMVLKYIKLFDGAENKTNTLLSTDFYDSPRKATSVFILFLFENMRKKNIVEKIVDYVMIKCG